MTRIDFYISERPGDAERVACRLTEKAYHKGLKVVLHCPDQDRLRRLDDLLWTFRQGSFLPHEMITGDEPPEAAPILLSARPEPPEGDVLINLDADVPPSFASHPRVLEIVDGDENSRRAGRARFKFYRDRGYPLQTHNLRGR